MANNEKFCLKWNDFESNIKDYLRKLRDDKSLFDVTIATEDGHELKAHRIIMSAGSDFFNDIFTRSKNHPNMYVFLKGVKRQELDQIADFLYNGETSIHQDEMKQFFEITKLLQIKGLQEDLKEDLQDDQKSEIGEI